MKKVLPTLPAGVAEIAWQAQERLHRKFIGMTYCRRPAGKVAAAVARERRLDGRGSTERRILEKALCGFDPRCLVRGSYRRMKDCEASHPGETIEYQLDHRRQS
jgi:hypothetical protein